MSERWTVVEVCHVYASEVENTRVIAREARVALDALRSVPGPSWTVVMIDDYNQELDRERDDAAAALVEQLLAHGVRVTHVAFESDCAPLAEALLTLVPSERRADETIYRKRVHGHEATTVLERADGYTCPALSAAWALAKLGVQGFELPFVPTSPRTLTVLPAKYMRTEATVLDLLREAGFSNELRDARYFFH